MVLVLGGLLGTLIIVRPGADSFRWEMLLPLLLVAVNVWFQLLTSRLTRVESAPTILLYTSWVGVLLATLPLYWVWQELHDVRLWWGLLFMGAVGGAGHLLLIMAFERTPASSLTPFMYGQIAFGVLGGYLVFGHVPDHLAMLGIGLIAVCGVAGGLLTVHENRALRRQNA
jgi:drug/metabolite transporter (DMT)-like permease